jgi:hypothetical protein
VIRCTQSFSPTTYIVAGGNLNGGFYRTTNGGSSWTYTPAGNPYDMYFPTETTGYAVGEGTSCVQNNGCRDHLDRPWATGECRTGLALLPG